MRRATALRLAGPALVAVALAGCAGTGPIARLARPSPPDPQTQMRALEARIYQLVEAAREKIDPKAKPLVLSRELTSVARQHSADMAAKHYLGHRSPSGQTSATIIMAEDANFQGLLGENLAAEYYTKERGVDVDTFAKRFVETWLKSKSHRENLAFPDYSRSGVGAAVNSNTVYVTQLFSAGLAQTVKLPQAQSGGAKKDHRTVSMYADPKAAKAAKRPVHHVRLRGQNGLGMLPGDVPSSELGK